MAPGARRILTDDAVPVLEQRSVTPRTRSTLAGVVVGGVVAGTVDIGAAWVINGLGPLVIVEAVASGLIGSPAFHGGAVVALRGYLLQCLMSVLIAGCYVVAAIWLPALRTRWIAAGIAYGVVVFAVMNYVVMPLSAVGHVPHFDVRAFVENLAAMLLFGLIVSFFARDPSGRL